MRIQGSKVSFLSSAPAGGAETVLATAGAPIPQIGVCSPDGDNAVLAGEEGGATVLAFKSGKRTPLYEAKGLEIFTSLTWTPGAEGLIGTSMSPFAGGVSLRYFAWPSRRTSLISRDPDTYRSPTVTASGQEMAVVRQAAPAEFVIVDDSKWKVLQRGPVAVDQFFAWDGDHALLSSGVNGAIKQNDLSGGVTRPVMYAAGYGFLQPNRCGSDALPSGTCVAMEAACGKYLKAKRTCCLPALPMASGSFMGTTGTTHCGVRPCRAARRSASAMVYGTQSPLTVPR